MPRAPRSSTPRRTKISAIVEVLGRAGPFKDLGRRDLAALAERLEPVGLAAGETLLSQDGAGDDVFVVLAGSLAVLAADGNGTARVAEVGPGDVVGENAVLTGERRAATVRANGRARVGRLSREAFGEILSAHPRVAERMAKEMDRRTIDRLLATDLARLFGPLDPEVREQLRSRLEWRHLAAGDVLFSEGEPADSAYFVVLGRLRARASPSANGSAEAWTDVPAGELVGAAALLDGGVRARTVAAVRDSYLVKLPADVLALLSKDHPEAILGVARSLVRQITQPPVRGGAGRRCSVVLIPAALDVDLRMFASRLAEMLSEDGPTFHLWGARVDSALGTPGVSQSKAGDPGDVRVSRWLDTVEEANRFLVFEADGEDSAWTRRALRQADHVLILADATAEPVAPGAAVAELIQAGGTPVSLVLLQRGGPHLPTGTDRWLDAMGVDDVIHLRRGSPHDLQRLGRVVSGRAVAMVFSGGGARGFAHLGVIRAMHGLGVPIDIVGGSSMGAAVATGLGMGVSIEDMIPMVKKRFARLRDYTLPVASFLKGKRITQAMQAEFGEHLIEDLWLPFFCITTNMTTFGEAVHRRGPLVQILRASTALPGVLPPASIGGEVHIDGGVINDFPIDVMRRLHPNSIVIGSDVTPKRGPGAKDDYGLWLSGMRAIGKRVGRHQRIPGIGDTLMRSMTVSAMRQRDRAIEEHHADLVLHHDMRGVSLLDFDAVEAVAERGYQSALPQLTAWFEQRDIATKGAS